MERKTGTIKPFSVLKPLRQKLHNYRN